MARIGLSTMNGSLTDPILHYQSEFSVPNIPGSNNSVGLTVRTRVSSIPGIKFDPVIVHLHGVELKYAGMPKYSHTQHLTILETRDLLTRTTLLNWMNVARDIKKTTGSFKSQYATTGTMLIYDDAENIIQTISLYGVYPESVEDYAMDGGSSQQVEYSVTLSFDYFKDSVES